MRSNKMINTLLLSALLLTGCIGSSPQIAYAIGTEHIFGTVKIKLDNDESQERFVLYYTITNPHDENHYFSFGFSHEEIYLRNSDQFEYSDNLGSKIEFDENGYYIFYTSRVFYISYKNADSNIKGFINEKDCTLNIPVGTFFFSKRST